MDFELQDRVFLITGGTDGLGLALARTLIAEGAYVVVCGRDVDWLVYVFEVFGEWVFCFQVDVV